jgi:hypothetical protein
LRDRRAGRLIVGPFESFYLSALQHPLALWGAALAGTWAAWARRDVHPSLRGYALALGALALLDAWLTASHVYGFGGPLPQPLSGIVPLFFVLAGDLRFLVLVESGTRDGGFAVSARSLLRALAWMLVVPLLTQGVLSLMPAPWDSARMLFLVYEVAFVVLCATLLRVHHGLRRAPWLRSLTAYVMVYYTLWGTADAVILATGSDVGFGLRVLPNLLYYGGFVAAVVWLAPRRDATERTA